MSLETGIIGLMNDARTNIKTHREQGEKAGTDSDKYAHSIHEEFWAGYLVALEHVQLLLKGERKCKK